MRLVPRAGRAQPLLVLTLALGLGRSLSAGDATVVVTQAEATLAVVAVGEENVVHDFVLKNNGDQPLTLQGASCSRGGSVTSYDRSIPPGAEGRLRVQVDTWQAYGPSELVASVSTNDPANPRPTFKLKVEVRPFLGVRPGYARFIFVQGAEPGTIHELIWAEDEKPFRILSATCPYPFIRLAFHEATPAERDSAIPGTQFLLDVTILSDPPVGTLGELVHVSVDHPRQKEVRLPLSGFVRPMFAVTPPEATVGSIDSKAVFEAKFFVRNFAPEPVKILGVTSDVPGVTGDITEIDAGHGFNLVLRIDPRGIQGPFRGAVHIQTSSPKKPTVDLPLSGEVRPSPKP